MALPITLPTDPALGAGTFIEFFAGVGLIHEALRPFGWKASFANDNDPKKEAAYRANFPEVPFSNSDIRELPTSEIPTAELATASFPCVDLSRAGGRRGINSGQSSMVWAFLDRIRELRQEGRAPRYLLIENVPGLLSHSRGSIDLLLEAIAELGYGFDLIQMDARHFLPQTRDRVFIICVDGVKDRVPWWPQQTTIRRYHVWSVYERNAHLPWVHFDFPEPPTRTVTLEDVIEQLPETDERWWDSERMGYFWSRLERGHDTRLKMMMDAGFRGHLTATRRGRRRGVREQIINLRFDRVAACLRTPKGGSSTQFVVEVDGNNVRVRRILGAEAARLQGADPRRFKLHGSDTDQLFAFGDAVCVPVVSWVMEHSLMKLRAGKPPQEIQMGLPLAASA